MTCGEPGMAEAPVDVLLYHVQCLTRSWSEMSHPGLSDYRSPYAEFPCEGRFLMVLRQPY